MRINLKLKKCVSLILMVALMLSAYNAVWAAPSSDPDAEPFKLGVEALLEDHIDLIAGKKVGLITNPTGVDRNLNSIVDLLFNHPDVELKALYGPEHGVRGNAQAGAYVEFYIDEDTGLPVYSLYGKTQKPTPEMLEDIDVLLFDIQDVGTRFYTYIYTMAYAMQAAKENHIPFIVLDRPNPLGGTKVEGPVLEPAYSSFVGLYEIPLRHGMTVGELAMLFNAEFDIGCDLTVVKMQGWDRDSYYNELPIPWVMPSPNMPTLDTAMVYPGAALIEGTNLSEGRGTTRPFELIGAPFVNGTQLARNLNNLDLPGVKFRAACFTPNSSKHSGKLSCGIQIHVQNYDAYKPLETGLAIVKTVYDMYPTQVTFTSHFNLLTGNGWMVQEIKKGTSLDAIINDSRWVDGLAAFMPVRSKYLLYGVPSTFEATLTGANQVSAGTVFELNYGLKNVNDSIYAQDITITYDPDQVEFVAAESVKSGLQVVGQDSKPGSVHLILASLGEDQAVNAGGDLLQLKWKAKSSAAGATEISLSRAVVSNGDGAETQLGGVTHTVQITNIDKSALIELIAQAQSAHDAATEGTAVGQYPVGSKAVLQAAIHAAKAVADNASATAQDVEQATAALGEALASFEASKIVRMPEDLNGDGKISIGDLAIVARHYNKASGDADWEQAKIADINGDGVIDIKDLTAVARKILE